MLSRELSSDREIRRTRNDSPETGARRGVTSVSVISASHLVPGPGRPILQRFRFDAANRL